MLLVRLDGIGDALVCTPLIAALTAAGHTVGVALSDRNAGIFARDRLLAEHVLVRIPWPQHGSMPASRARAEAEIAAMRYDVALIASEEPDAYTLAAPVPQRVGFTTGLSKPLKTLWLRTQLTRAIRRPATVGATRAHEAAILYALGDGLVDEPPPRALDRLRPIVLADPSIPDRPRVVVGIGPKWLAAGVDATALGALTSTLAADGARFISTAAERDELTSALRTLPIEVPADIEAWKAAVDGARAFVTVDSGGAHLAGMLGVPTVDIFPDVEFERQSARWRPWAAPSALVRASTVRDPSTVSDALAGL